MNYAGMTTVRKTPYRRKILLKTISRLWREEEESDQMLEP